MKPIHPVHADWRWGTPEGSRQFDRLMDQRLTFREKIAWLEEAETLTLRLRASRERRGSRNLKTENANRKPPRRRGRQGF